MKKLRGKFWTSENELIEDLDRLGYEVLEMNDEILILLFEDEEFGFNIIKAGTTIIINI